jgi:tRNA pseudouridine55 synthase
MFGFLNINKPLGRTSRDVVNRVAGFVRPHKAGHAGTLDPLATGVLVVGVGAATRLFSFIQDQQKSYVGTFELGKRSNTEDLEGTIETVPCPPLTRADIEAVLPRFTGRIQQTPTAFSAILVNGQRAYVRARRGEAVEMPTREVEIARLVCREFTFPHLTLEIDCGSGTYIRSLGRDIAESLGTSAVMTSLVRTQIGPFSIADAVDLKDLTRENIAQYLRPAQDGVRHLPHCEVSDPEKLDLRQGRMIPLRDSADEVSPTQELVAVDRQGIVIAIVQPARGRLAPTIVFHAEAAKGSKAKDPEPQLDAE